MNSIRSVAAVIAAVMLTALAACTAKQADGTAAAGTVTSAAQTAAVTEGTTGRVTATETNTLPSGDAKGFEGIALSVSPEVVSDGKLTLTVSYSGSGEYYYGESYSIEKEVNGEWIVVEPKEGMSFFEIAYLLSPESQGRTQHIDLSYGYGDLPAGRYRVVKNFSGAGGSTALYAPFTVA